MTPPGAPKLRLAQNNAVARPANGAPAALSARLLAELSEICGPEGVISERDRLLAYESDGLTAYRHRPGAVVLPRSAGELRAAVKTLSSRGLAIVPRGAGTGLSGGAVAVGGEVVVGTARMNRILEIDPANRRMRLQPGAINAELSVAAAPHGLHYAPDPSSQSACTVGGNVAENSGGPHCLKYGVTSRYVTGLSVVLADGSLAELGGMGKETGGYDLAGLFVGSEGCFGIAAEIEVRLAPLPEAVRTLLAIFGRLEDAGRAVSAIVGSGLLPAAMEIIDGPTIRAVENSVFAAGYPQDAEAALVVEFDGLEAGLGAEAEAARRCCEEAGASEVRGARDEAERAALWRGRKKAFGAMGRIAPDLLVQDATVPRSALPAVLGRISEIARESGLSVANVFHAGDGNLHPNILFDRSDPAEVARVEKASTEIMQVCVDAGGTITGEHGVGIDKKSYMHLVYGPDELHVMHGLRRAFDPNGIFNPGKVLPDALPAAPAGDAPEAKPGPEAERVAPSGPAAVRAGGPFPAGLPATVAETLRLAGLGGAGDISFGSDPRGRPESFAGGGRGGGPMEALAGREASEWAPGVTAGSVLFPRSADEVQALVAAANRTGASVLPAGWGSWLEPGSRAREACIVLSTARLDRLERYEPADLTLSAGAGRRLRRPRQATGAPAVPALDDDLAAARQWLPLDAPGAGAGTLGGLVATGGPGPMADKHGGVRDNILGLEMVTGDGRRLNFGGRVVKNVAGYDLVRLATGSRGSLAILTSVSVRLFPQPEADLLLAVSGGDAQAAQAAAALGASGLPLAAVELFGTGSDEMVIAVRMTGGRAEVEEMARRVHALAREHLRGRPRAVRAAPTAVGDAGTRTERGPDARLAAWLGRHEPAEDWDQWEADAPLVVRLSALPSLLPRTLGVARELATAWGGDLRAHALQGVARVKTVQAPEAPGVVAQRLAGARAALEEMGGSLVISRAPRAVGDLAGWARQPESHASLAARIKELFDPAGVLAPRLAAATSVWAAADPAPSTQPGVLAPRLA